MTTLAPERPMTVDPEKLTVAEPMRPSENGVLPHSYRDTFGALYKRGTAYLAGPMRGYPEFNFPAFDKAAYMLRQEGWDVLSPAEHDRAVGFDPSVDLYDQPKFDLAAAFRWDIQSLLEVDAVYFLKDYEASVGAITEHSIAVALGLQRMYEVPRDEELYEYLPHISYLRRMK